MTLTKKDLIIFLEKNNFHTKKNVKITKKMVESMSMHDIGCLLALLTFEYGRTLKDSLENAEAWMLHDKTDILKSWFTKDVEASF